MMRRAIFVVLGHALGLLLGVTVTSLWQDAWADGPGAYRSSESSSAPGLTKEQRAIEAYNEGYTLIQRADESAKAADESATKDAQKAYKAALKKFNAAVKLDPSMHEAHTYLGYANRKLGNYDESLKAYAEALRLNPSYPQAIEYQGEAFLGLNRIDDAKTNYLRLYALDRPQAHKLLRAINQWTETNAAQPPANVDVNALRAWVTEREGSHDANEKAVW
ncbi:MAG: tetratricopeptide repeat protein [Steroidobacteraceae bacterium]